MAFLSEEERRLFLERIRPAVMIERSKVEKIGQNNIEIYEVDYDMKKCAQTKKDLHSGINKEIDPKYKDPRKLY